MKQDLTDDSRSFADDTLAAINRGVRKALIDHKRNGDPIVVWKDGKVVWVPAEDIVILDEPPVDQP